MTATIRPETIASTDIPADAFTRLIESLADHPVVAETRRQIEEQRRDHEARARQQARRDIASATSGH
ncbi:MAG: hypothetical protein IT428_32500 [Planctomycetaceae bacterium]|nr:hypothetical protein [Planctomycetaceae bacterium]